MSGVIVLNASYEHHQVVPFQHALKMLARKVAVVEVADDGPAVGPFPRPKILRLIRFVYAKWKHDRRPTVYSKAGVHRRDGGKCGYCLRPGDTIDHILPRSRGGRTTWLNTVTACRDCNRDKDSMTPGEAGMPLLLPAWDPTRR
jgi:hypothetical protein